MRFVVELFFTRLPMWKEKIYIRRKMHEKKGNEEEKDDDLDKTNGERDRKPEASFSMTKDAQWFFFTGIDVDPARPLDPQKLDYN